MKILYLECNMGAAGDMLLGALWELLPDREGFLGKMNGLGLPGVKISAEKAEKCGILGTHISVTVDGAEEDEAHGHHHHGLGDVEALIGALDLPEKVKMDARAVYRRIGEAESRVHGKPARLIHFHEVGALDAVADVVGVCLALYLLAPDKITASPVHVGSGQVRCAHGLLPVPAPATAELLGGIPMYGGKVKGELCTPTGAALLAHFVSDFGEMPAIAVEQTGYGMGKKDFEAANCLRAFWGRSREEAEKIAELRCNLDDMTPEEIGFAQEALLEAGALDVFTTPIGMKKSRPGVLLTCLCRPEDRERLACLLFRHTTTLGIRETLCRRYTLRRREEVRETEYGPVRVKISEGFGARREKAEYEDLAKIAREQDISLRETRASAAFPVDE